MDEDYDYDDDTTTVSLVPGRQVTALDFVIVGIDHIESLLNGVKMLLCQRVNYGVQRKQIENEMRADIEAITRGGE